ncbi:Arm DNA-binding domain-containing protein [Magnetovirga frankeli]|uniref:Arm DNA-binding domain-containing protein n=1 Tax=Magnetovirga frankeli TaxID=947516 RepID=UPI003D344814
MEKLLALGKYPEVSLADAREAKAKARQQIQGGTDTYATKNQGQCLKPFWAVLPTGAVGAS